MPPESLPLRSFLRCVLAQQTDLTQKLEVILNGRDWRNTQQFRRLEAYTTERPDDPSVLLDLLVEASRKTSMLLTDDERAHLARWPSAQYFDVAGSIALAIRGGQNIEIVWTLTEERERRFVPEIADGTVRLKFLTPIALIRSEMMISVG